MKKNTAKNIIIFILLLPVVLLISLLIYYQFDEELLPEVVDVINYVPEKIAIEENGYYALLGMFVEEGEDPHAKGIEIAAEAKQKYDDPENETIIFVSDIEKANVIKQRVDSNDICIAEFEESCLRDLMLRKDFYEKVIQDNELLIKRLRNIYEFKYYQEAPYIIAFNNVISVHKIALLDIISIWKSGKYRLALDLLLEDINYWRMVAGGDVPLITRMIAIVMLNHNQKVLSEFVSDCTKCIQSELIEKGLLKPFSRQDTDMSKTMGFEYRYIYNTVSRGIEKGLPDSSYWEKMLFKGLFKENSTHNKMYGMYQKHIELSKCKIENYVACYEIYVSKVDNEIDFLSIEFIKDPVGEILIKIAEPAYHKYVWSAHRLEVVRRLINVKYLLYRNKIDEEKIGEFLEELPNNLRNPVTNQAIEWDADARKLRMTMPPELQVEPESINI